MTMIPMRHREDSPPLWLCVAILTTVFTIMLRWTWLGWPDPIVDFGRELYVPWQLAQGKVLYRDIAYFNGPLSPYFNALIFTVFGASLRTLVWTNAFLLAGLTAMLFALLASTFNRCAALAGCVVQLTIFSFIQLAGIGNYNFITPYSHELTHGLILSVAALLILRRKIPPSPCTRGEGRGEGLGMFDNPMKSTVVLPLLECREKGFELPIADCRLPNGRQMAGGLFPRVQGEMFLVGLILGLIFLTKIEIFIAAAGAIVIFIVLRSCTSNAGGACSLGLRSSTKSILQLALAASIPPLIALALLRRVLSNADALHAVLGSFYHAIHSPLAANPFYQRILGSDALTANLLHMNLMFALDVAVFALIYFATHIFSATLLPLPVRGERAGERAIDSRSPSKLVQRPIIAMSCIVLTWLAAVIAYVTIDPQAWQSAFAALPLLLLVIAAIQFFAAPKGGKSNHVAATIFTLFAFLLMLKMLFAVRLSQYGFVLALPALLALIGFLLSTVPAILHARGRDGRLFAQLCLPLIALIIAAHLRPYAQIFSRKPIPVATGADQFFAGDIRGVAVNRCLAQLAALPANATVAVVPEGVMINYLAKRVNPTKYVNLLPPEVLMFGEEPMLRSFTDHPPDYIVFNDGSDPREYGVTSFKQYAGVLNGWIEEHYEPTNNATMPQYPLRILRRK